MNEDFEIPSDPFADIDRTLNTNANALKSLEKYWSEIRGARHLPVRSDVDPVQIDALLPSAFVLERVAPGMARMRVAGQIISQLIGVDGRGMPLSVMFSVKSAKVLGEHLEKVFSSPAIVELPLVSHGSLTRGRVNGRMLILPLSPRENGAGRAIGAIVLDGRIGARPRRFDIPLDQPRRCEIVEANEPIRLVPQPTPRLAQQKGPAHARPALRLVVDNSLRD